MKLKPEDREVFGAGGMIFGLLALLLAAGAVVMAATAYSRSNDANDKVAKLVAGGILGDTVKVDLQEFTIGATPLQVKAGKVHFNVKNLGSIGHEVVVARAASVAALPLVTTAGERAIGAVDEEAVPAADTVGEVGEMKAGGHAQQSFELTPGTYILYCNIDTKAKSGVVNHFHAGMSATLTVV